MSFRFRALVEDQSQEQFLRGLLDRRRIAARDLRVEPYPKGRGAAEQFVRREFPRLVRDLRSKRSQLGLWGLVVIDGDMEGFRTRRERLLSTLEAPLAEHDRVLILVPTRNIETWAWKFLGNSVDEVTDYKSRVPERLRELFERAWEPPGTDEPASLLEGRREWRRLP